MKRVYIAGPISRGNLAHNVNQATAAFVTLAKAGIAPFNPMWSVYAKPCSPGFDKAPGDPGNFVEADERCVCVGTRNGNDEMAHADWLNVDLPWVAVSDAVLRLPGESTGADREVAFAESLGIPVYHSIRDLLDAMAVSEPAPVQTPENLVPLGAPG